MRRRIIIISIAFIVVIGVSLAIIFAVRQSPTLQKAVLRIANTNSVIPSVTQNTNKVVRVVATPDKTAIQFAARNFTELYGSYSNENSSSNIVQAEDYATVSYAKYLQAQIALQQAAVPATAYSGMITKALVFTFIKQTTISASVVVTTQRTVLTSSSSTIETKDILLDLMKVGSDWKINAAVWK